MKVLLFVQTGDARPKSAGSIAQGGPIGAKFIDRGNSCYLSDYQSFMLGTADRWWLVECENAAGGRLVIRASQDPDYATSNAAKAYWRFNGAVGRILASGGKP